MMRTEFSGNKIDWVDYGHGVLAKTSVSSVQSLSLIHKVTLCDPMACRMPVFPVHHQLPELTQTHVHRVNDAIQPSHPLSSSSPPSFNISQQD